MGRSNIEGGAKGHSTESTFSLRSLKAFKSHRVFHRVVFPGTTSTHLTRETVQPCRRAANRCMLLEPASVLSRFQVSHTDDEIWFEYKKVQRKRQKNSVGCTLVIAQRLDQMQFVPAGSPPHSFKIMHVSPSSSVGH
jgi:hypothetical protein